MLTSSKITMSKTIKMIKIIASIVDLKVTLSKIIYLFVKNHFVLSWKMIKNQLVIRSVKTTYGIFYLWCPKPKGFMGPQRVLGYERTDWRGPWKCWVIKEQAEGLGFKTLWSIGNPPYVVFDEVFFQNSKNKITLSRVFLI